MTKTDELAINSYNAALAHSRAGRFADARACYERAIAIDPGYVRALNNLGTLLDDLGEHGAAESRFRTAIAVDPDVPEPWTGLGTNLRIQGRLAEARAAYEHALALRAVFPAVRWNLAMIDLAEGRFAEGWMNYLFRPGVDRMQTPLIELPDDLTGTIIEIADEQGLGDALFFMRFVPALRARGSCVRYRADARISGIVARMMDFGTAPSGAHAIRVALGDLPYLLVVNACPVSLSVTPLPGRIEVMRAMLEKAGPPPYIGVTWRAGQRADGVLFKEVPPDQLGAALRQSRGTLIDVQRAPQPGEHARLEAAAGRRIADLSGRNEDIEDMLALMNLLDDYVAVSNTNIHLRAAVGRVARVLVANPAEYRWMAAGETAPWFPGFTLYRQSPSGAWDSALAHLTDDLRR